MTLCFFSSARPTPRTATADASSDELVRDTLLPPVPTLNVPVSAPSPSPLSAWDDVFEEEPEGDRDDVDSDSGIIVDIDDADEERPTLRYVHGTPLTLRSAVLAFPLAG